MMRKEKSFSVEQPPLLYTTQPKSSQPVGGMQKVFVIKQHQLDLAKKKKTKNKKESLVNTSNSEAESEETKAQVEEVVFQDEKESISVDSEVEVKSEVAKKKLFSQMTNVEKINYIVNRPHYIPNAQCIVRTKKDIYIGYILSFEKNVLKMRSSTYFSAIMIELADIVTIQLKGLE